MFALYICLLVASVVSGFAQTGNNTLFYLLPTLLTSINFSNKLTETDSLNFLNQANIYNGGGVGIDDFNRDGLPDVYFAGNVVSM